jgi:hypothetical protein
MCCIFQKGMIFIVTQPRLDEWTNKMPQTAMLRRFCEPSRVFLDHLSYIKRPQGRVRLQSDVSNMVTKMFIPATFRLQILTGTLPLIYIQVV